jgi:preprotein translocase subunit SecA
LRRLLPDIIELDQSELAALRPDRLGDRLMELAYENEAEGYNLYQLLQAMGRFLPLLPPIPNLGSLAKRRSGQLQAREKIRKEFLAQVERLFNEFLAEHVDQVEKDEIWETAAAEINHAFSQFNVESLAVKNATTRQHQFRKHINETLRELLLDSLSALDGDELVLALTEYVQKQQAKWQERIGKAEYRNFQRQLLLSAIDREWRDYLTAMDDLRREIGLEAVGQRNPKVEYKRRSFEMFSDMRHNIERDVADRFFRQIRGHEEFIAKQEQEEQLQLKAQDAGYQVVQRDQGRGVELRRDVPKVGRNDPCPCGSGKKYKHCHGRKKRRRTARRRQRSAS